MFYSGCFGISDDISLFFTTFFEFLTEFSQWFCYDSLLLNAHSMLAASPFYSVILGFRGTTDSLHFLPWVPEPMLCQPLWWLVLSLFLIVFFFWCCFHKSLLLTFHSRVSLESKHPISLPSRLLNLTLFKLNFFGYLSFCHFFQVSRFHPYQVESFPSYFSSWFFFSGLPEVPAPCSWIVSLQAFWFLSASLAGW